MIIEFPKQQTPDAQEEAKKPSPKKVFNIADWTRDCSIPLSNALVDNWPFSAA